MQVVIESEKLFRCSNIQGSDPSGIHHYLMRILLDRPFDISDKTIHIGKKEIATETIDHCIFDRPCSAVSLQRIEIPMTRNPSHKSRGRHHCPNRHFPKGKHHADDYTI